MRPHVLAQGDGILIADWDCNVEPAPPGSSPNTTDVPPAPLTLRAVLGEDSTIEIVRAF